MPLVGGADLNGTASNDPTDLRFNRPYRASPTGLKLASCSHELVSHTQNKFTDYYRMWQKGHMHALLEHRWQGDSGQLCILRDIKLAGCAKPSKTKLLARATSPNTRIAPLEHSYIPAQEPLAKFARWYATHLRLAKDLIAMLGHKPAARPRRKLLTN
eukprot:6203794-Pleurochrysis_carterae.AAC.6